MTKAYAQMNTSCAAENGAGFAARVFALILILVALILGALCVPVFKHCRRTVG